MKKILLTGTSGFIASYLYKKFTENGYEVLGIDKIEPKESYILNYKCFNILDKEKLSQAFKDFQPDTVLHLAARTDLGEGDTLENFEDNTKGTENIVDVANNTPSVKKLLFTSTILVLPVGKIPKTDTDYDPKSPYGESKMLGEIYIRKNLKSSFVIVRPTSIWGPSQGSHYQQFFDKIFQNSYFNISGFDPKITFGYLGNFYYQFICLLQNESAIGNVYYLGDYKPVSVRKWASLINMEFKGKKIKSLPYFLIKGLALVGDFLIRFFKFKKFPMNSYRLKNLTNNRIYNLTKTQEIAPDLPYNLERAVKETTLWYKTNIN